jgi:hypothetical protein
MKPVSTEWVQDLDPTKKKDFEEVLRNSTYVLTQLRSIIDRWDDQLQASERGKKQYDVPNWQVLQAHRNGNAEYIQKMKDLLNFF